MLPRVEALAGRYVAFSYGQLSYAAETYRLTALRNRDFDASLPTALVTGGVHGYETSGVSGALEFLEKHGDAYAGRVNLLVVPCVSPWGYERVHRWNYDAVDPNRNFNPDGPAEAKALIGLVEGFDGEFMLHIDLHETTDSDETEFAPSLAARDGKAHLPGIIPDGFYLVADAQNVQLDFQAAIIAAVEKVTHIAPPDENGRIIGSPVVTHGVIEYECAELGLCTSVTNARFVTTTEVYPDSPHVTPDLCNQAQVTAICAALDFALAQALQFCR